MNRFNQDIFESPDVILSQHLKIVEAELKELSSSTIIDDFPSLCEAKLESCIQRVKPKVMGGCRTVRRRIDSVREKLNELYAHENQLAAILHHGDLHSGKRAPWFYYAMYGILILGAVLVFGFSYEIIFPEQSSWLGMIQALVMAGPSFLISYYYKQYAEKDRFLRRLHLMGIYSGVLLAVSATAARAIAYHLLSSGSVTASGSFLNSTSSSSWLEQLKMIAGGVAFLFGIFAEVCFASRLMILVNEYGDAQCSVKELRDSLADIQEEIEQQESQSRFLGEILSAVENFDDIAAAGKEALLAELLVFHDEAQGKLRDGYMDKIKVLPTSELRKLAG